MTKKPFEYDYPKDWTTTASKSNITGNITCQSFRKHQYGWICPKCGRVYSPLTIQCFFCGEYGEKHEKNNLKDIQE